MLHNQNGRGPHCQSGGPLSKEPVSRLVRAGFEVVLSSAGVGGKLLRDRKPSAAGRSPRES